MIRWLLGFVIFSLTGAMVSFGPAIATPAKEAPWLPDAAAYRLTLFLGNLEPLPWDDVEAAWSEPYRNSEFPADALTWLVERSDVETGSLLDAMARRDRQSLFAAATRLIALRIEEV